jgi:O-methyltransferase
MKASLRKSIRTLYVRYLRPHISQDINRQRLKLIFYVWGYWHLIFLKNLSPIAKLKILWRFLVIDWFIVHGHRPFEISVVCKALAERRARDAEVLLEAGCFNGGSSAKFSIICSILGYRLCIYDSFEGVEEMSSEEKAGTYDFSGEFAASEELVRNNISEYGEINVCTFYKGWFADTLASNGVPYPVRVAFIDCDLAKGTREALQGIVPALIDDGWIFSQDFHIKPVIKLLLDTNTWIPFGKDVPTITRLGEQIASIRFEDALKK